jgi:antitoxin Phd
MATHTMITAAGSVSVTASDAKKDFGKILEHAIKGGVVTITRHDAPKAVLISVEQFEAMRPSSEKQIKTLRAEFDAMFERMQRPGQRAAMQRAFDASPKELGRAAREGARMKNRG